VKRLFLEVASANRAAQRLYGGLGFHEVGRRRDYYALGAGKFANRFGYFLTLKIGFIIMAAGLAIGSRFGSLTMSTVATCAVMAGTSCIWPAIWCCCSATDTRSPPAPT